MLVLAVALPALLGAAWLWREANDCPVSVVRNPAGDLMSIVTAQERFRREDLDRNQVRDYWRGDIAGLYGLVPKEGGERLRLISVDLAGADARPAIRTDDFVVQAPRAGYWFRALRWKGETTLDSQRFAAICYPDSPSAGRFMYIVSHEPGMYRKAVASGPVPEAYPVDPLNEGWSRLD